MIYGVTLFVNLLTGTPEYALMQPLHSTSLEECKAQAAVANEELPPVEIENRNGQKLKIVFGCYSKPEPA